MTRPAKPRVLLRPEIDDGAARARRTRESDATCAGLVAPDGTGDPATPATDGSIVRAGRDGRGETAKPFVRCEVAAPRRRDAVDFRAFGIGARGAPRVAVQPEIDDGVALARGTREPDALRAAAPRARRHAGSQ